MQITPQPRSGVIPALGLPLFEQSREAADDVIERAAPDESFDFPRAAKPLKPAAEQIIKDISRTARLARRRPEAWQANLKDRDALVL